MAVDGVGIDAVDVARLAAALHRTPTLAARLFTPAEQGLAPHRLAARLAAKEAAVKALRAPRGWGWHDAWVDATGGPPVLHLDGALRRAAAERGVVRWHVSLSHERTVAVAVVVTECG